MSESSRPKTPFISGGHMLETPPLSARIIRWIDRIYLFFGLYFVTLFSRCCLHSSTPTPPPTNLHSTSPHPETKPGPGPVGVVAQTEEITTAVVAVAVVVESRMMEVDLAEGESAGLVISRIRRYIRGDVVSDGLPSLIRRSAFIFQSL
ncbi:conserved hypothetical protein [Talaromyces marneffei ATCC 18224]|uniref:Uncharacterized protein n=1 Tax=Talaromyces marneffei (strain ATCC 18224 / CBS 334.59 / QM 7333) TaxID=441960 RepID=B6QSZ1_TALMQ|nr:conserved hypothetical protein [Talaromyces marneffei ATCC 18224]